MKKLSSIFLLIILSAFYISCSPLADTDGDLLFGTNNIATGGTGSTGGTTTTTGSVIKKFSVNNSSSSAPLTVSYLYTNNKISSVNYSDDQLFTISYNQELVSKIVFTGNVGGISTKTTYDLIYNGNLLTEINEVQEVGGGSIQAKSVVTYTNGKVSKVRKSMLDDDTPPNEITYMMADFEYNANNISKFTTTTGSNLFPIPPSISSISYSDYDSKKNPFNLLPKEFNIATLLTANASLGVNGLSENNFRKITSGSETATYTYIYNKDNYPVSAKANSETSTYEYY